MRQKTKTKYGVVVMQREEVWGCWEEREKKKIACNLLSLTQVVHGCFSGATTFLYFARKFHPFFLFFFDISTRLVNLACLATTFFLFFLSDLFSIRFSHGTWNACTGHRCWWYHQKMFDNCYAIVLCIAIFYCSSICRMSDSWRMVRHLSVQ